MSRRGVAIRPPYVNYSGLFSSLLNEEVIIGLDRVKILSGKNAARIINERTSSGPYKSFSDLLERVRIPLRELQALVLSGACDGLAPLDPRSYPFIH